MVEITRITYEWWNKLTDKKKIQLYEKYFQNDNIKKLHEAEVLLMWKKEK